MILKRDESETDCLCHKGTSLQKVAVESPDKFYIPLEHYTRVTENLCLELRNMRDKLKALKKANYVWKWLSIALFGAGVLVGHANW
jgi:hypothetical protein